MGVWQNSKRILVLGHRGYSSRYTENTLKAFHEAIKAGADGVELDVRLSLDKIPVVFHDATLDRLSEVEGKIGDYTLKELKKIKLPENTFIPTLEEVLDSLPSTSFIDIEIKEYQAVDKAFELVKRKGWLDRVVFTSFSYRSLKKIRKISGKATIGYLISSIKSALNVISVHKELSLSLVAPPIYFYRVIGYRPFKVFLRILRKDLGLKIALWTVNDPAQLRNLKNLYDIIITDEVDKIVSWLNKN